jgi:medium-chain acyl-[acyl-carrier-protein] hydrolase
MSWVVHSGAQPDPVLRLFCLPHAGGGASAFQDWAAGLGGIEVAAVRLPGREGRFREPAIDRMDRLVEAIAAGIGPLLDRRYALYGHSVGALVAFELARRLRSGGWHPPVRLIVAACDAPRRLRGEPLSELPDDRLVARLAELGGMPAEVTELPELVELLLPVLRADIALADTYAYRDGPPLDCPILAFHGERDELTSAEGMAAWRDHTTAGFAMEALPGGHFFPRAQRDLLLQAIRDDLRLPAGLRDR